MSGIYIPGMEMPKNCEECPVCDYEQEECLVKRGSFVNWEDRLVRQPWCPLVPVPPHGDLVERQAVLNTFSIHMNRTLHFVTIRDAVPTIIPAEEDE